MLLTDTNFLELESARIPLPVWTPLFTDVIVLFANTQTVTFQNRGSQKILRL